MTRDELLSAGFVETTYTAQEGVFLAKRTKVADLPYSGEHLVDNNYIFGDMLAVTELTPSGLAQLSIGDADYAEVYPSDSEEGKALLKDAVNATAAQA